ncbi:MAG TPA: DUF3105 domain-containing protein [Solirubrobacteraceae bacterium]|nr:DUF3105 domain-containing protein [Solirubrobacteraceae bacterium]
MRLGRLIERLAIALAALAIAIGVIALLSGGLLAGSDQPGISGAAAAPGVAFADQGAAALSPGQPDPLYDSDPPTSGPHHPAAVTRDGARLTNDQLLQALQEGNVVLMYGGRRPPAGLEALAARIAPFTPALAAAGGAVILATRPGVRGIVALAWTRMLRVATAGDPRLLSFIQYWLGRGYRRR